MRSIITDDLEHCIECGKPAIDMHVIYFANQQIAEAAKEEGLVIPLCWECNRKMFVEKTERRIRYWKKEGQLIWTEKHPEESFESRFGKNYL